MTRTLVVTNIDYHKDMQALTSLPEQIFIDVSFDPQLCRAAKDDAIVGRIADQISRQTGLSVAAFQWKEIARA